MSACAHYGRLWRRQKSFSGEPAHSELRPSHCERLPRTKAPRSPDAPNVKDKIQLHSQTGLTLALSGWPLASPLEGRVRRTSLREAEAACCAERGEQAMLALKLMTHNRRSLFAANKERGN